MFLPVFPVLLVLGADGPFGGIPEWLFNGIAFAAEFVGVFLVVHAIRLARAKRRRRDA